MAIKPDYSAGLATLANGGTTVTFSGGANITAADIQPGDTFKVQNLDAIIATVTDATHVELTAPWTGTALVAAPYRIRFQPDGSRFTAALRDLVTAIGGGSLAALQAVTGAANKIPYFTSATTMALADFKSWALSFLALTPAANKLSYFDSANTAALTDLTAAGRALLDDADASAQLTTLGVSAFAKTVLDDASGATMFNTMGATQTLAQSGYQKLPSGMILQWGSTVGTTAATGGLAVTLPVAFSGNLTYVAVGYLGDSGVGAGNIVVSFVDQTSNSAIGFRFKSTTSGNSPFVGTVRVTWVAMGY